ncbi:hypothetical protein PYCCODRAFT_1361397, partial [Trametes coccinea BRFM310]
RAQVPPLHTETGIWPIRYRRLHLVLRFLAYLLRDCPPLPLAAFTELWRISCTHAQPTWWTDLHLAGCALPVPVLLDVNLFPTPTTIQQALGALSESLATHLRDGVCHSQRLPVLLLLLQHRILRAAPLTAAPPDLKAICAPRAFLHLPRRRQRDALCLLLFSEHPLAIEQLRRAPAACPIPRLWRVCRFCRLRDTIEDEIHTLSPAARRCSAHAVPALWKTSEPLTLLYAACSRTCRSRQYSMSYSPVSSPAHSP